MVRGGVTCPVLCGSRKLASLMSRKWSRSRRSLKSLRRVGRCSVFCAGSASVHVSSALWRRARSPSTWPVLTNGVWRCSKCWPETMCGCSPTVPGTAQPSRARGPWREVLVSASRNPWLYFQFSRNQFFSRNKMQLDVKFWRIFRPLTSVSLISFLKMKLYDIISQLRKSVRP